MNYKHCAVPKCKSSTIKTPNKLFIIVPQNGHMRKKWLKLATRVDRNSAETRMYFCEDHFDLPNDMENYMQYHIMGRVSRVLMKPDCTPSKFECHDSRKRMCSSAVRPSRETTIIKDFMRRGNSDYEADKLAEVGCDEAPVALEGALPKFCGGCFSVDRDLKPLGDLLDHYYGLIEGCKSAQETICLCWECGAFLRRLAHFKRNVVAVQTFLHQYQMDQDTLLPSPLSRLAARGATEAVSFEATAGPILMEVAVKCEAVASPERDIPVEVLIKKEVEDIPTWTRQYDGQVPNNTLLLPKDDTDNDLKVNIEESTKGEVTVYIEEAGKERIYETEGTNKREQIYDDVEDTFGREITVDIEETTAREMTYEIKGAIKREATYNDVEETFEKETKEERKKRRKTATQNYVYIRNARNSKSFYTKMAIDGSELATLLERDRRDEQFLQYPYRCVPCVRGWSRQTALAAHTLKCHSESPSSYQCDICSCRLGSMSRLRVHVQAHYYARQCTLCEHRCANTSAILRHVRRHQNAVQCRTCRACFLVRHNPPTCALCPGRKFLSRGALGMHRARHHSRPAPPERAFCVECDKQFTNVAGYKQHLAARKHRERSARPACPDCGKTYARKAYMQAHYNFVHLSQPKYRCSQCDLSFINSSVYQYHLRRAHQPDYKPARDKVCAVCGRGFVTKWHLANHARTHTGERPFACALCDARFGAEVAMRAHVSHVHLGRQRKPTPRRRRNTSLPAP